MSVSPTNAVNLLDEAVSLAPAQWPGRAALQARMIEPLAWCGRFDDAEAIANTILAASPDADVEFAALRGLCAVYGNRGDMPAAIAALHRAAAAPGAPDDEAQRLRCMAAQLSMLTGAMSVEDARHVADETMAKAVADGDLTTQCLAHQVLGVIATVTGYSVAACEHLAAAVALLDSGRVTAGVLPHPRHRSMPSACSRLGALDDASGPPIRRANEPNRRRTSVTPAAVLAAAGIHFFAGRWDDALAELEAGLEIINDTGNFSFVLYFDAVLAKIAIHRGDLRRRKSLLTAGTRVSAAGVSLFGADWLFGTQAEFLAASGELEAALKVAETTWTQTAPIRYFYGHRARGTSSCGSQ